MSFSLGDIDPLNVQAWEGFDFPETAVITPLLGDGSATSGNAVFQQSALPVREAPISGTLTDSSDLDSLRGYFEDKQQVSFTDDDSNSTTVYVFDLRITRVFPSTWNYACRLVEAP